MAGEHIPPEALQPLQVLLGRYFAAETDLNFAARPWLVGELPAPVAQLHDVVERLRVLDELGAELRGECRAVYRLIQAQRERKGAGEVTLGRWTNDA